MKQKIALVLSGLMMLCALWGCGSTGGSAYVPTGKGLTWDDPTDAATQPTQTEAAEQELTMVYTPADTYNPYLSYDTTNRAWMSLVYEGLFAVDDSYEAHPILCGSYWLSNDMMTYVFYIRQDATFSDGTALTLGDAYASLSYALESDMYKGRFQHVEDMYITTDGGIAFKLNTPYENFPILLDVPILKSTQLSAAQPLGTGPYRTDTVTGGMRLVRVNSWWANTSISVTASSITLRSASDPVAVRDAFELQEISLVCADPSDDDYAQYRCDYELWDCENGTFLYLAVNTNSWITGQEAIRSTLTYAIDRDAIVKEFYHSYGRSATLCASPLSPYYDSTLASQYAYDPEIFNQAVADNALVGSIVTLLVDSSDPQRVRIAERIADMLEESGLVVEIAQYTGDDYRYVLAIKRYDLHLGQTKLSATMDLSAFFSDSGKLNYGGLSSSKLYALCLDSLANAGNYYTLLKAVADDGRLCPILFETYAIYGERGAMTDLKPSRDNVFYYDLGTAAADILLTEAPSTTPTAQPDEAE